MAKIVHFLCTFLDECYINDSKHASSVESMASYMEMIYAQIGLCTGIKGSLIGSPHGYVQPLWNTL